MSEQDEISIPVSAEMREGFKDLRAELTALLRDHLHLKAPIRVLGAQEDMTQQEAERLLQICEEGLRPGATLVFSHHEPKWHG